MRIIVLGGLGEVGMNCLALEQGGEALVIDCGVTFDDRGLGIDVVHPDFGALEDYRVAGIFVTHGHEDHIGAIPYFLRRFDVPVFGPAYALRLVRERAQEHEVLSHADLRCVKPRESERVGSFEVEPIRVTHSIADATALAIRTDAGLVVHTGDFKFDDAPPDGETFDVARFEELGGEGVDLLFSDSTNIDAVGPTGSEEGVGSALDAIVAGAEQAVVVAMFASNVHRLRMLGEIARRYGRKIVPLGRSVSTHARVAQATARSTGEQAGRPYLEWPSDLVWPAERARELPRKRAILAVATGSQGERAAALSRLARGDHSALDLTAGDVVVLSSRVIPGNEPEVVRVMNDLLRRGVELRSWWSNRAVHVSGHAHRQEQRRMIELVQPRAFVPVHGTLHHLLRHAELARELGVPSVTVLENGDVATLDAQRRAEIGPRALGSGARHGRPRAPRSGHRRTRGACVAGCRPRLGSPRRARQARGRHRGRDARRDRRGRGPRAPGVGAQARARGARRAARARRRSHRRRQNLRDRAPCRPAHPRQDARLQTGNHREPRAGAPMTEGPSIASATGLAGQFLVAKLCAFDGRLAETVPRLLASGDGEAVHDFRVALRRTRTLLEVGRVVFGRFHTDEVRAALRDVQRTSGVLRDEEVLLELLGALPVEGSARSRPPVPTWASGSRGAGAASGASGARSVASSARGSSIAGAGSSMRWSRFESSRRATRA